MTLHPNWLALPVALPMLAAALGLISYRGGREIVRWQRGLALTVVTIDLVIALLLLVYTATDHRLVLHVGGWHAPFGIALVADTFSALMLTLSGLLTGATLIFAQGTLDQRDRLNFYPLILTLLMGVNGAFLAGDLFNLYVFFEVLLMASFALLTLGGQRNQIHGGIRYVVLNLLASIIFLTGAAVAYGTLGTLNLAHMAQRLASPETPPHVPMLLAGLLFVAFASKAGIFPLFFWLPSSYHTPHPAITALFGGILTKVGIYSIFRTMPLLFPHLLDRWQGLFLTLAGLTMLVGILGALSGTTLRRGLSFQIISHVGFIMMGFGVATAQVGPIAGFGLAAAIFYLIHHMVVKTALLMAGGAVEMEMASGSLISGRLGGLIYRRPLLALLFFLSAISLAGVPPFSGFVSKLSLLQATMGSEHWFVALVSVLVSVLTLMFIFRLWQIAFWGESTPPIYPTTPLSNRRRRWYTLTPIALLVTLSLLMGIFSSPVFDLSVRAASQLLDGAGYIDAVNPVASLVIDSPDH